MSSLQEIKAEFIRIYEDMVRAKGQPAIFGRVMAVLLLEGRELSHKEISDLTGYSISSVSRTLDQMGRMGIVHKHKDVSLKHFVFHVSVDFPEMLANSLETLIGVYGQKTEELKDLTQKVSALKSKGKEKAEIDRLQSTLRKFEKTLEFVEGILKTSIKELRSQLR